MLRRLIVLRAVVVVVCALILARLIQLQVIEGDHNRRLAEQNRIRVVRRLAPRGTIYDRHSRVLATSRLAFSVGAFPEELEVAGARDAYALLGALMGLSEAEVKEAVGRAGAACYEPIILWRDVDTDVLARLEEHAPYISGVAVLADAVRSYPHGSLAAHVLGYVREIGAEELARARMGEYRPGDLIGKAGIEKVAEEALRGTDGGDQIEVDARGRPIRSLGTVAPCPGRDVWLTLDLDLQRAAERALGDRAGAVVAMDPWTGDILALCSHPAYDPNLLIGALSPNTWKQLTGAELPQHNRTITSRYPPGSVFKVVTAAAALESGACDVKSRFHCSGVYHLGDWSLRCGHRAGHGNIDFLEGFAKSCNIVFATLGRRVGPEGIADMAHRFGLGEQSGIELPGETAGLVPTPAWKRAARHEPWYPGDTCQMAIGQGDCLVSPLQVAREVAVVANGGTLVRPRLIAQVEGDTEPPAPVQKRSLGLRQETIAALRAGMQAAVAPGGTAASIATSRYEIAAKTGSAQVPDGFAHAWFAGYAPSDSPKIAVAVIVEHGGHGGTVAGAIARHIFDTALLPDTDRPKLASSQPTLASVSASEN
jgi:penicillin-binding protein 2